MSYKKDRREHTFQERLCIPMIQLATCYYGGTMKTMYILTHDVGTTGNKTCCIKLIQRLNLLIPTLLNILCICCQTVALNKMPMSGGMPSAKQHEWL